MSFTEHIKNHKAIPHIATDIVNTPAGTIAATTVQAALNELDTEKETPAGAQTKVDTHVNDATDAHAGSAITNTPAGTIAATTVQAALNELDTEKESTSTSHASRHVTGGGDTIASAVAAGAAGLMTGADKTKIDGIEALADVTDATNVAAAGAEMYSNTRFKIGLFSRDSAAATGTQAVTGLGFTPLVIFMSANIADTKEVSIGEDNGTIHHCLYNDSPIAADCWAIRDNGSLFLLQSAGNEYNGYIISLDADGFTIQWTKTGTTTGTINITYRAFR